MTTKTEPARTITGYDTWSSANSSGSYKNTLKQGSRVISYEDGPRCNRDGSPRWKRCQQTITDRYTGRDYVWYSRFPTSGMQQFNETGVFSWISWAYLLGGHLEGVAEPDDVNIASACRQFTNEVYGQVPSAFLSMEDVAGFLSGRSIVKSADTAVRSLVRLVTRKGTFKDVLKGAAGLDLGRKFSVQTTISDIEAALSLSEGFAAYVAKLGKRQDRAMLYHTTLANQNTEASSGSVSYLAGRSTYGQCYRTTKYTKRTIRRKSIEIFGRYRVHYPESFWSRLNYRIARLGLDKPLSTIWAIIPLSFVVDYFVSVQTLMNELDSELNRSQVGVVALGEHWMCSTTSYVTHGGFPAGTCGYNGGTSYPLGKHGGCEVVHTTKTFNREPLLLSNLRSSWAETGSLTLSQKVTLTELLLQII